MNPVGTDDTQLSPLAVAALTCVRRVVKQCVQSVGLRLARDAKDADRTFIPKSVEKLLLSRAATAKGSAAATTSGSAASARRPPAQDAKGSGLPAKTTSSFAHNKILREATAEARQRSGRR